MDSSVIDAMAGCHGNGGSTEGSYSTQAINMNFVATGTCACCLWQIRQRYKVLL